jgi:hypothetical protein
MEENSMVPSGDVHGIMVEMPEVKVRRKEKEREEMAFAFLLALVPTITLTLFGNMGLL